MISDDNKANLAKLQDQIQRYRHITGWPDIVSGALKAAFFIGQVSALSFAAEKSTELAEAKAPPGTPGPWPSGYVEGGNDLIEALCGRLEELNGLIAEFPALPPHPQD